MKKIIIPIIIFILALSIVNATLIDSEDFESFTVTTNKSLIIEESNGDWNCSSPYSAPNCVSNVGSGSVNGFAIENDGDNYLRFYSYNGTNSDYSDLHLVWDNIDSSTGTYTNFSISYDIKIFQYSQLDTDGRFAYHKMTSDNPAGSSKDLDEILGGISDNTFSNHSDIRFIYDSSSFSAEPTNSDMDISDGNWHEVITNFIFDDSENLIKIEHYLDDVLKDETTLSYSYSAISTPFWDNIILESRKRYDVGIDNIELYQDELYTQGCQENCIEWGNKAHQGVTTYIGAMSMQSGQWYCQKQVFYKSGTVENITTPFGCFPYGCNITVRVTDSLTTGAIYQGAEKEFLVNIGLYDPFSMGVNFTVSQGQTLYFCGKEMDGSARVYGGYVNDTGTTILDKTNFYYPRHQDDYNVGQGWGVWNGTFPITERGVYSPTTYLTNAYGGYVYTDGTGNMFGDFGEERKVSTLKYGEFFIAQDDYSNLYNITMIVANSVEWGGTDNFVRLGLADSSGEIASCSINASTIQFSRAWDIGGFASCDISGQGASLTAGENYTVYMECFTSSALTTNCDGTLRYLNIPTLDVRNNAYVEWQSFQGTDGHYFTSGGTGINYEDVYFTLGADESDSETEPESCSTNCTTWESPYALRENFDGYINNCDWVTTENVCFDGVLEREQSDNYYSAYKDVDTVESSESRYVTIGFDIKPTSIASNGWVGISLYDSDYQRFIQFLIGENGYMYNNENGNAELKYSNVSTTLSKTVNLHIDFTDDDFDLWYDEVKVATGLTFTDSFMNIENLFGIRVSSDNAEYELDNVEVFATDQNNNPVIVDFGDTVVVDSTKQMCNLFFKITPDCVDDSDCESGKCGINNHCSVFDYNYCDENSHVRGNYCVYAGVTNCVLTKTKDLILDHMLLFLTLLILIIIFAYLILMMNK